MSWKIHPERLIVVEDDDGPHADEPTALAALVTFLHAERDKHRACAAAPEMAQHERRAHRHRIIQLEYPIVRARRRQKELGIVGPLAWDPEPKRGG